MNPHTDEVLEGLRPRMKAARIAHVRRMMACLAMVPIIGPCYFLGIPIGIWAFLLLRKPGVRESFRKA